MIAGLFSIPQFGELFLANSVSILISPLEFFKICDLLFRYLHVNTDMQVILTSNFGSTPVIVGDGSCRLYQSSAFS